MVNTPKIDYLLHDLDGVIAVGKFLSEEYDQEHNLPQGTLMSFIKGDFQKCLVGILDLKEILPLYLDDWKWKGTIDQFLDELFRREGIIDKRVMQDILNIQRKGKVICGLATNQELYRTRYLRNNMGFDNIFGSDYIFTSVELGAKKPHADFFYRIQDKLGGVDMKKILFVDDMEANVDAAAKLGINVYHYEGYTKEYKMLINNLF